MTQHSRHDYVELALVYLFGFCTLLALVAIATPASYQRIGIIAPVTSKLTSQVPPSLQVFTPDAFSNVNVQAKAYVVYDIVDGTVIAGKNETMSLPLASITKVMTAITAWIHATPDTKITIRPSSVDGAYDLGLKNGQTWKLSELLKYTLIFSSNDGAQAIADNLGGRAHFVELMNEDASTLGLPLIFTQPAGLDLNGKLGGEGSALTAAKLFAVARRRFPMVMDATTKTRGTFTASTGKISGIPNTNQDIENLFGAEASKTGFTDSAGGNLGVIVDITIGHPVAIVVLGSTREARFTDMETLYKTLQKSLVK
jgi:D-alanyl-D-alanine carboxypeptidase